MATKQQSMKAKKQQRTQARKKAKQAPKAAPTNDKLAKEAFKNGILATARKYRGVLEGKNKSKPPTNEEISQGILNIISVMTPIHSYVEISSTLVGEGKITFTPEETAQIDQFDKDIVHLCEDITALNVMMGEGLTFDHFSDLFVHYIELSADLAMPGGSAQRLYNEVLKKNGPLISNWAQEHKLPGETDWVFAMRLHDLRIERILPIYRTVKEDTPLEPFNEPDDEAEPLQEFIPADDVSDAELIHDVDVDELRDVNEGAK